MDMWTGHPNKDEQKNRGIPHDRAGMEEICKYGKYS